MAERRCPGCGVGSLGAWCPPVMTHGLHGHGLRWGPGGGTGQPGRAWSALGLSRPRGVWSGDIVTGTRHIYRTVSAASELAQHLWSGVGLKC